MPVEPAKLNELDQYLRGQYFTEKQEIEAAEALIAEVFPVFMKFWF